MIIQLNIQPTVKKLFSPIEPINTDTLFGLYLLALLYRVYMHSVTVY